MAKLIEVLQSLVDKGNTVLIIEHNPDIIKIADHIIDLGPEGGDDGGYLIAEGTPEEVALVKDSHTGRFLADYLEWAECGDKHHPPEQPRVAIGPCSLFVQGLCI